MAETELDLWRSGNILLERYGGEAAFIGPRRLQGWDSFRAMDMARMGPLPAALSRAAAGDDIFCAADGAAGDDIFSRGGRRAAGLLRALRSQ